MLIFRRSDNRFNLLHKKVLIRAKLNFLSRFYNRFLFWLPFQVIILYKFSIVRDNYLRTIQSQIFLIRANEALEDRKNRLVMKNLKVALELLGQDLSPNYKTQLISNYRLVLAEPDRHERTSLEIVESTSVEISNGSQNCIDSYYYLSKFLNWGGFLNAALLARDKSTSLSKTMILENGSSERQIEMYCGAHLESGDLDIVESVLHSFDHKFRPDRLSHFRFHLNLLRAEPTDFVTSSREKSHDAEIKMNELIKGKTVALIGTGVPLGDYGDEIDSYDLVVRVKYPGTKNSPTRHGRRCDVAYYTSLTPFELLSDIGEDLDFLNGVKALMIAQVVDRSEFHGIPILFLSNIRSVYPKGDLTSGLMCLANLLRFQPSLVNLFGFDLYAMPQIYNDEMVDFYRKEGFKIGDPTSMGGVCQDSFQQRVQGHFWHDQIANFLFGRNLFLAGAIKIEPVSAEIFSLTPKQYASRLEIILRNLFLKI